MTAARPSWLLDKQPLGNQHEAMSVAGEDSLTCDAVLAIFKHEELVRHVIRFASGRAQRINCKGLLNPFIFQMNSGFPQHKYSALTGRCYTLKDARSSQDDCN